MDMDPMLVRATRLLHSTSKTSADQLRAMLEDAIKQRYGDAKSLAHLTITKEYIPKKETSSKHSSSSSSRKEERDVEKKRYEKMPRSTEVTEPPKPAEPIRSKHIPASHEIETIGDEDVDIADDNVDDLVNELEDADEDDDDDDDDDDLALEILEDDLSCVVCRGMSVGALNQLVECLECHSLYHQECHQPPVARSDINDPRCAWYCATCTKAINKQPAKSSSSSTSSSSSSKSVSSATPATVSQSSKSSHKTQSDAGLNLFKRQDSSLKGSSSSSSKSQASSASAVGMAGLAASFQPAVATGQGSQSSKSTSSSSSSSAKVAPPKVVTNVISADKRLANMKKKAAAKQQEKRKHSK